MASNPVSDAVADAAGKAAESIPSPARFYLAQTLIVLGFATFALWHTGKSNRNFDAIMDRMVSKEDFQAFEKKMDEAHEQHDKRLKAVEDRLEALEKK